MLGTGENNRHRRYQSSYNKFNFCGRLVKFKVPMTRKRSSEISEGLIGNFGAFFKTSAFNRLLLAGVIIARIIGIGCLNHRFHSVSV